MIERLAIACMGTRFELVLAGTDRAFLRAAGEEALAEIEACDQRLSRFRSDSVLRHINRSAAVTPVPVDDELFDLLLTCEDIWRTSGGAFDASVGAWMRPDSSDVRAPGARDRAHVGWGAVELQRAPTGTHGRVSFAHSDLQLDLGAIGKGFALDNAARALTDAGVTRALLQGGTSTALALGAPARVGSWTVAVGPESAAPRVHLESGALSVSAPRNTARSREHVLDPRSGLAAMGIARAAVIAPNATLADAWSTALLVMGDGALLPANCNWACARASTSGIEWRRPPDDHSPFRFSELDAHAS